MSSNSLMRRFAWAFSGLFQVVKEESNMRFHLVAAGLALGLGWVLGLNTAEWGLLILVIFFVWVAEVFNTAVERVVDLITPQYHPLAEQAKNMAAGAVLLSAIAAVILGLIVFAPHIFEVLAA